jgi:hypothetical protein
MSQMTSLELAGCYVVTTDVSPENISPQEVHDSYVSLQKADRAFRVMKTGLLEVRPLFVRKSTGSKNPWPRVRLSSVAKWSGSCESISGRRTAIRTPSRCAMR